MGRLKAREIAGSWDSRRPAGRLLSSPLFGPSLPCSDPSTATTLQQHTPGLLAPSVLLFFTYLTYPATSGRPEHQSAVMMDDEPSPWADAPSSPPPPPRTLSPASIRKSLEIAPPPPTSSHIKHSSPLADDSFDSFDEPAPTNGAGGDDDDGFGQHAAADEDDGFDDFDDPAPVGENGGDDGFGGDDDFGDFGDFEEDGGAGFEEEEEEGGELDRRQETTYASPPPPQAAPTYVSQIQTRSDPCAAMV